MEWSRYAYLEFECSYFKSIILIGSFKISVDNYHDVTDSKSCVRKTARVIGSRRVTQCVKAIHASHPNQRAVPRALLQLFTLVVELKAVWFRQLMHRVNQFYFKIFEFIFSLKLLLERSTLNQMHYRIVVDIGRAIQIPFVNINICYIYPLFITSQVSWYISFTVYATAQSGLHEARRPRLKPRKSPCSPQSPKHQLRPVRRLKAKTPINDKLNFRSSYK